MEQNLLERILDGTMEPTILPFETLRKITDEFSTERIVGEGGFGTVYKGVVGNKNVAVKRIMSSKTIDDKLFRREVNSLMEVNHENIVQFLGLCSHTVERPIRNPESRGFIYAEMRERLLCFEYISNGSLDRKITDELRGLEWDMRYKIIKGICTGLNYLHNEKGIIHMDLKPANILLNDQMTPKIMDFGLSRPTENSQTTSANHFVSRGYTAPENIIGGSMTVMSDVYSLGIIIIEVVTGHRSTPDTNNTLRRWWHRWTRSAKSTKEVPLEYHQQVTECMEIGRLCLNIDRLQRPSISKIMSKFAEMDSTNDFSKKWVESNIGQIYPPAAYWEDNMLRVEPLELQFSSSQYKNEGEILSWSVELCNGTVNFVAFKIQRTSPLTYSIEPNMGIVKPGSKCSVNITLAQGHKATLRYSTSNKQYTEEFIVRSIKVNEDLIAQDIIEEMFNTHTSDHNIDEIHLAVVSKESCSKEVVDFPSKQAKKQYTSSYESSDQFGTSTYGVRSTPVKAGSVQLVIKSNEMAPLFEYRQKVLLELTGGDDYTRDRPGLDLVAILDVSASMGSNMDQLKSAMDFVIMKLSSIDRLSMVTFSSKVSRLCPLKQMNLASQHELRLLISGLEAHGGTNIKDGLLAGLKILQDRKFSNGRVASIMLMSDGHQTTGDASTIDVGDVPVFTFSLGANSDTRLMSDLAAKSMGGTFSHVQDDDNGGLTMAFSQCLAGLLTVVVQNLELTVASIMGVSTIVNVNAGSYTQRHIEAGPVIIKLGNLYGREVRKVIVDLLIPATQSECIAHILDVTYSHSRSFGSIPLVAPSEMLTVWRRKGVEVSEVPSELRMEEARLQMADMIQEAQTMADDKKLEDAQDKLKEAHNMLEEQSDSDPLLRTELQELLELLKTQETYEKQGRPYALSSVSSHGRQRFTARGGNIKAMRLFVTPRMNMYLQQVQEFVDNPERPVPYVDDDVKEELIAALTKNVSSSGREEEMRRLSLEMEE